MQILKNASYLRRVITQPGSAVAIGATPRAVKVRCLTSLAAVPVPVGSFSCDGGTRLIKQSASSSNIKKSLPLPGVISCCLSFRGGRGWKWFVLSPEVPVHSLQSSLTRAPFRTLLGGRRRGGTWRTGGSWQRSVANDDDDGC